MLRQFSWIASGRIFAAILQLVSLGLVASQTRPFEFGYLAALLGLCTVASAMLGFGITTHVTRARAADISDSSVTYALLVNSRVSAALLFALCLGISCAAVLVDPLFWLMLPLAVWIGSERNAEAWACVALADGDAHVNSISLVGRRMVTLAIQVVCMLVSVNAILAFSLGSAIGALLSALFVRTVVAEKLPGRGEDATIGGLLKVTWPYWLHSAATQVRNIDTALVVALATPAVAGMYAIASRLTSPLRILPLSLAAVLLPGLTRKKGVLDRRTIVGISGVIVIFAVIYTSLAAMAGWAVPLFFGDEYLAAVLPVQIVCVGLTFGAAASLLASVLQARGLKRQAGYISLATAVYCVAAIVIGTVTAGAVGAAIGLVSSFAAQAALMLSALGFMRRGGVDT